jgi:hypothetical protein
MRAWLHADRPSAAMATIATRANRRCLPIDAGRVFAGAADLEAPKLEAPNLEANEMSDTMNHPTLNWRRVWIG